MKILLADDHPLILNALPAVLNSLADKVEILLAKDFPSAFEMMEQNLDVDLLLMDLTMPGMDGFDAVENDSLDKVVALLCHLDDERIRADVEYCFCKTLLLCKRG